VTRSKSTRDASHAGANPPGLPPAVPVETSSATRQRLLETAEALFYEEGFHAVGLDRLLAAVEISKPGFYRHFACKEDLVVDVIRWHDRWWREKCRRFIAERAGGQARRQLETLAEVFIEVLSGQAFRGCFFINAIAEFPNPHHPVHRAAVEAKDNMEALVRDLALCAGADDPVAFAREFAMIFEGAFASRYLRRADDVVPILRRMTGSLFDLRLPTREA
jgi:AcrR family transcriptional regulator